MSTDSAFSSFDQIGPTNGIVKQEPVSPANDPPPKGPMIVFGSQGSDFLNGFDVILDLSGHYAELAAFLALALDAVRKELQSVANRQSDAAQRQSEIDLLGLLPPFDSFSDLKTLVDLHRRNNLTDPVVNGVLLCLLQTASVVAVYCVAHQDNPEPEPLASTAQLKKAWKALAEPWSHLLGFCTGALSAFSLYDLVENDANATPVDIWAYARDAIKVIRICFWVSLRSAHARVWLSQDDSPATPSDHWSFIVSVKDSDYIEKVYLRLQQFNELEQQRPMDKPVPVVVTAKAVDQVSIGGPPKQLERFKQYLLEHLGSKCRVLPLKIYSPYHTPLLEREVDLVMLDLERRGLVDISDFQPSHKALWETVTADVIVEKSLRAALRLIIASNLSATADWISVVEQLMLHGGEDRVEALQGSTIVSMGPGIGLAADLQMRFSGQQSSSPSEAVTLIDIPALLSDHAATISRSGHKTTLSPQPDVHGEEVVIVSMACRFPGDVRTPEQLWTCFETGRSTVTEIPKHLFDIDAYLGEGVNQTMARHMHALPEDVVKSMDARLFSMSPKEIEQLDPQHRLVMLCSYEALERAGYSSEPNSPSSFDGKRIAVCMAASWDDYRENASWNIGSYFITGNIRAFIPGHVSFSLKWEGPSVSVDSLECSAVSAIQWSRRALLSGQCDAALAGAVNVLTQPQMFIAMDKQGILSRTGTNATFSSKLDGKTRGDGCGVLLLKRRSTALKDGDTILATLPAARTTYHGLTDEAADLSARQSDFLSRVMSEAGVKISNLVHIEASGFHTQQGEAAEFESFKRLLAQAKSLSGSKNRISVASSRPNIGAGEAMSAMASVMKAVLMFTQGGVPRQVSISNTSELQPKIAAACADSALFVPIEAQMLPSAKDREGRRHILVNSLASTGSHGVVLVGAPSNDEVPPGQHSASDVAPEKSKSAWVFVLSAKIKESADMLKKALINFLQREVNLADLSYSLACRRTHHPFRLSVVASDQDELIRRLRGSDFVEAQAPADLPLLGFVLRDPHQSSYECAKLFFKTTLGLQDRYDDLVASIPFFVVSRDREAQLRLMLASLCALLSDCGIRPSIVDDDADPVLLFSHHQPDKQEVMSTMAQSDAHDGCQWIKIDTTVSISVRPSDDHATSMSTDAQELQRSLLSSLGQLHQQGYAIRWIEFFRPHLATLSFINTLPTYPFHLQQHWMEYHDRNLLPRVPSQHDIQAATKDSAATPVDADELDPPTQPLLTKQTRAEGISKTFCAEVADEVELASLKSWSSCGTMVELMVESIKEVTGSIEGVDYVADHDFFLRDLNFGDTVAKWLRDRSVTLSVESAKRLTNSHEGSVRFEPLDSVPLIGCRYEMVQHATLLSRWAMLQKTILTGIANIKAEGELFSARLVYKALANDSDSGTKAIRTAHIDKQSEEAVLCISIPSQEASTRMKGRFVIPQLLSSIEECARWFAHSTGARLAVDFGFSSIEELFLCNHWLQTLTQTSASTTACTVYISHETFEPLTDDHFDVNILIFDGVDDIVGELSCARLTKVDRVAGKNACKAPASMATSLGNETTQHAASAPQPVAKSGKPQVTADQLVESKPTGKSSTGRASELHNKVLAVLAAELGIAVEEMKPSVKFADLGLDSLMSLVCISTLETLQLGFEIPQSLFLQRDSPAELLQWFQEQVGDEPGVEAPPASAPHPAVAVNEMPASQSVSSSTSAPPLQTVQDSEATQSSAVETAFNTIQSTIETELGVAAGSIPNDANLADLGMDSLMSLLVLGNLAGTLPIELPASLFMDCTSLREIRAFLSAELGEPSHNPVAVSEAVDQPVVSVTIPTAKKPVLLRQGTDPTRTTPLFLLPDGSGMSTVYQHFHAIDRPIYSLNSPYLSSASSWTGGITPIAHHYLASMRLVQPTGPYLVGGWSFGGMVAFEIARLLSTSDGPASDRVTGLFLLDSPCPLNHPPLPMSITDWILTAPEVKDIAPPALSDRLVAHFKATVESLEGWQPTSVEGDKAPKTWYVVADHALPGRAEDVEGANETVRWLFLANRAEERGTDGWDMLVPGEKITVCPVKEANHFTLVREPKVGKVAQVLQEACRSVVHS